MKPFIAIRSFVRRAIAFLKRVFPRSAPPVPPAPAVPIVPPPQDTRVAEPPPVFIQEVVAPPAPAVEKLDDHADRPPTNFSELLEPILAIDLGAAYTKVSFRSRIQPGQPFAGESTELVLDGTALIPSIVLCDPAGTWHFGSTAAGLRPGVGWQAWENWKRDLFDSDDPPATALLVATRFFAWLRGQLEAFVPDIDHCRVRIALPAFQSFARKARLVKDCMAKAGWEPAMIKPVREPQANIIGLTSRGRNQVTWSAAGEVAFLHYGRMFGHLGLIQRAANDFVNQARASKFLKGLVVDLGAYTTDIAPLIIDVVADISEYGDGITALNPTSSKPGISAELDQPLFQEIFSTVAFARSQVTFLEFELLKQNLYAGKTYVTATEKGEIELGTKDHLQIIDSHFERFADALWAMLQPVAAKHKPEWIALTGGGGCIARLSEKIRQRIGSAGFKVAPLGQGGTRQTLDAAALAGFRAWSDTGIELTRLATALGGTNVLLDVPSNSTGGTLRDLIADEAAEKPAPAPEEIQCHCKGLNEDCPICDGRGYVHAAQHHNVIR
jgi:hypothetical protein